MTRNTIIAAALVALALFASTAIGGTPAPDPAPQADTCAGFRWGDGGSGNGKCWQKRDGSRFTRWLQEHGSTPQRFRKNYPELAQVFGTRWGIVKPAAWKNCSSSSCVPAVIEHVFGRNAGHAKSIAYCESRNYPRALGAAGERGIFQIHPVHFGWLDENRLWEPLYNTRIAYRMSRAGTSWGPWTCARYV